MVFTLGASFPILHANRLPTAVVSAAATTTNPSSNSSTSHLFEATFSRRAAEIADKSAGFTAPHPNYGCIITTSSGAVAGEGFLYGQGTESAELQAVQAAGERCRGATAFLNLESSDCPSDNTAVAALVQV